MRFQGETACHLLGTFGQQPTGSRTKREELLTGRFGQFFLVSAWMIPLSGTRCDEHRRVEPGGPGETTDYVQREHDTHL